MTGSGVPTARQNECDCPHIVELKMLWNGFDAKLGSIHDFHRDRGTEFSIVHCASAAGAYIKSTPCEHFCSVSH
jgi:hypothetical protein